MEDRELIELAAKAAGIRGQFLDDEFWLGGIRTADNDKTWSPLGRDGDAFRLASKLHMTLVMLTGECEVLFDNSGRESSVVQDDGEEGELNDAELTRRAIVRAAAEIGRSMP